MISKSILKLIVSGDLLLDESKFVSTPIIKELNKKIEKEQKYFEDKMDSDEKIRFDDYNDLLSHRTSEESSVIQFDNFMLGIIIGMEIMEHKQILISNKENE